MESLILPILDYTDAHRRIELTVYKTLTRRSRARGSTNATEQRVSRINFKANEVEGEGRASYNARADDTAVTFRLETFVVSHKEGELWKTTSSKLR